MWPLRQKRPKLARNAFSAFLRGRLVGASIGLDGEAEIYASDDVPVRIRTAFTLGVAAKRHASLLSECEVGRKVADLVDMAQLVEEVERGDDPGSSPRSAAESTAKEARAPSVTFR